MFDIRVSIILVLLLVISTFAASILRKWIYRRAILTEKPIGLFVRVVLKITRTISTVSITLATLQWLIYIMTLLFGLINSILNSVLGSKVTSAYLSLTLLLVTLTYFPGVVKRFLITFKRVDEAELFTKACKLMRPKLLVFLMSFVFVLLSSLESFLGRGIISNLQWLQIKPVILQAVVTVIAFDRLIKHFKEEKSGIQADIKGLADRLEKWMKSPM